MVNKTNNNIFSPHIIEYTHTHSQEHDIWRWHGTSTKMWRG